MRIDATTVSGFLLAGGGITISEIELWEGWISLAIKLLAFIVMVITVFIYWNKYQRQKNNIMIPGESDNESGQGGDLEPREDEDNDQ